MNYHVDWQLLSEEKKRDLIKALADGCLRLLCKRLRLDYNVVKKEIERLKK